MKLRCFLFLPAFVLLSSCAVTGSRKAQPEDPPLVQAQALQKSAGSPSRDVSRFVVSHLQAAELARSSRSPSAESVADNSTAALAAWMASAPAGSHVYTYGDHSYRLDAGSRAGDFPASSFESMKPASAVPRTLVKTWEERPGAGVPMSARWHRPDTGNRFVSPRGYVMPVTACLEFGARKNGVRAASMHFVDPTVVREVKVDGRPKPLAADFSAPLVDRTRDIREMLIALEGLLHSEVRDANLAMLQPYNPKKIPVVFVHGLLSHPRMWRDVVNELMADPLISGKYQFWVYYYPTGWPIAYSAMRLRDELASVDKFLGHTKPIILVGHSMGGLLARLQVVSPGDSLVRMSVPPDRMAKYRTLPADHILRKTLEFRANPNIERIVFICTPHRGSRMADWSLTTWATKFIQMPRKITSAAVDLLPSLVKSPQEYSSVSRLSPSNPLYKVLEGLPIRAPYNSIIGDRGRGDTPNSSDGVVPYWSSHLDGAESEVIVPDDHGAFDDPAAIRELRRILMLNAKKS